MELDLAYSEDCIISQIHKTPGVPANPNANLPNLRIQSTSTSDATLQISSTKILNLLKKASNSKFLTRKWNIVKRKLCCRK